jgi:flagella basal body P-ring formation protein FlgA
VNEVGGLMSACTGKWVRLGGALTSGLLLSVWAWAGAGGPGAETRESGAVWVLARSIPKGGVLSPEDVTKKTLQGASLPAGAVEDPSPLLGMRAVRSLQAGTMLRAEQFKPEPILRKGQKVEIVLEKGGLRIVAPGEALEEGGAGQRIRVLNSSSRQVVMARVENAGAVRVEF